MAPQFGDTSRALAIFRNLSENKTTIPQLSLIVSCLMQDLNDAPDDQKPEIFQTMISLINLRPDCVQEHDIQNVILEQTSISSPPIMVLLSLRLLNTCHLSVLQNSYQVIINKVRELLNIDEVYPEIVLEACKLLKTLSMNIGISDFMAKIQIARYLSDIEALDTEGVLSPEFREYQNFFLSPKKIGSIRN